MAISRQVKHMLTRRVASFFAALCDWDCLAAAAKIIRPWLKRTGSHITALCISASEIVNATTAYYAASLLLIGLFMREKMMCWWLALPKKKMWLWIASFGDPYKGDVLHFAKQVFFSQASTNDEILRHAGV